MSKIRALFVASCGLLLTTTYSLAEGENIITCAVTGSKDAPTEYALPTSTNSTGKSLVLTNGSANNSDVYFKTTGANAMSSFASISIGKNVQANLYQHNICLRTEASIGIPLSFTMEEGSSFTSGSNGGRGGFAVGYSGNADVSVKGDITVNGRMYNTSGGWTNDSYLVRLKGNITFYKASSLTQTGVHGNATDGTAIKTTLDRAINSIMGSTFTSFADAGKIKFDDYLFIVNSTLNLKSSNAIISGAGVTGNISKDGNTSAIAQATSQADSTFFVWGKGSSNSTVGKTTATINAYDQNNIGALNIWSGSTVTLDSSLDDSENNLVNKGVLQIGELILTAGNALTLNIKLDSARQSMQIENFSEFYTTNKDSITINLFDTALGIEENNVSFDTETGLLGENFQVSREGWITAVPEPAEWAFILGLVACLFVSFRRRK